MTVLFLKQLIFKMYIRSLNDQTHLSVRVAVTGHAEDCIQCAVSVCEQGGAPRDPPDQSQEEGLSAANNSQATPPIPVPAIVKVSNI